MVDKTSQNRMTGRFLSDRICHWIFSVAAILHLPGARERYWNSRADEIDRKWGTAKDDFAALRGVIESIGPHRLLDIGCGSGRLFPLYNQLQINEVLGQDISRKALVIASKRCQSANITMTNLPILRLDYPAGYFDLIVSNRGLLGGHGFIVVEQGTIGRQTWLLFGKIPTT